MKTITRYALKKKGRFVLEVNYKYPFLFTSKKKAEREKECGEKVVKVTIVPYDDYEQMKRRSYRDTCNSRA